MKKKIMRNKKASSTNKPKNTTTSKAVVINGLATNTNSLTPNKITKETPQHLNFS